MPSPFVPIPVCTFCQAVSQRTTASVTHPFPIDPPRTGAGAHDRAGPDEQRDCRATQSFRTNGEKPRSPNPAKSWEQPAGRAGTVPNSGIYSLAWCLKVFAETADRCHGRIELSARAVPVSQRHPHNRERIFVERSARRVSPSLGIPTLRTGAHGEDATEHP